MNKQEIGFLLLLILFGIILSLFCCYPYINNYLPTGHDMEYHLNRINGIVNGIKSGEFISLIDCNLNGGLGYANNIFYPYIFLYIPAILIVLGIGPVASFKIFVFLTTFFTTVTMYISSYGIFKNKKISVLSSILYTFSLYRLTDLYVRGAIGEFIAFVFVPLVIYGVYELAFGNKKNWWILAIALFGVVNSHIISAFLCVIFIILFLICNIKVFIKDKTRIKYVFIAGLVSILLALGTILPILEQFKCCLYKVNAGQTAKSLEKFALLTSQIFENSLKYGYATKDTTSSMNMGVGILLLILPFLLLFSVKKNSSYKKFIIQLLVLAFIFIIMTTSIFPWRYFSSLNVIQFPWRLNMIITAILSIVGAFAFVSILKDDDRNIFIIFAMICVLIGAENLNVVEIKDNGSYSEVISRGYIAKGEYLPVSYEFADSDSNYVYNLNNVEEKIEYTRNWNQLEFKYDGSSQDEINVPLLYYKGYSAYIESDSGTDTNITISENTDNGILKLKLNDISKGVIIVKYSMTTIQKISYTLTYTTLVGVLGYVLYITIKNKRKKS